MTGKDWPQQRTAMIGASLWGAVVLLASGTALAPRGLLPAPWEMLGFWFVGALAALHRPWGGTTLGLGALVLPLAAARLGPVPTAWLAALQLLSAELARRRFIGRRQRAGAAAPESWLAVLLKAPCLAAAALVAAALAQHTPKAATGFWSWGELGAIAAYLAVLTLSGLNLRRSPPWADFFTRQQVLPLLLDAGGWGLGMLLANFAPLIGWPRLMLVALAFALLAAEAARTAMLYGISEHRRGDLQQVHQAPERIVTAISNLREIAQQVLIECRNVLPVSYFQFELLQPAGARSWTADSAGALIEGLPQPPSSPPPLPGIHRRASWHQVELPLLAEQRRLATVRLWCDPRQIEPGAEELLASLVPHLASSVHRAILDQEAKHDPLTGVPVRRVFESRMQVVFSQCCEEGRSMAIILCDIDHFKRVNDTYGHAAGDQALVQVARTLAEERREKDLCCRYGGEEFAVLLEDTAGDKALHLADRLRQAVAGVHFGFAGQTIPLTLSAGVAAFPELHVKTASELFLLADEALYAAKEQGRNRCLLHLGRGRFRGLDDESPAPVTLPKPAPRIFG